jgi:hypothetical protein
MRLRMVSDYQTSEIPLASGALTVHFRKLQLAIHLIYCVSYVECVHILVFVGATSILP